MDTQKSLPNCSMLKPRRFSIHSGGQHIENASRSGQRMPNDVEEKRVWIALRYVRYGECVRHVWRDNIPAEQIAEVAVTKYIQYYSGHQYPSVTFS